MEIRISKTDLASLLSLIDKASAIIKEKSPTIREKNVARQLGNIKKKIQRNNQKAYDKQLLPHAKTTRL